MARPKSNKARPRKKTPQSKQVKQMSAELKKQIKLHERLATLEKAQQKVNDVRVEEAQVVANLMFSVNAIAKILTEKKISLTTAEIDENGFAVVDEDGRVKTKEVEIPLSSMAELNLARAQVINDYHKEREAQLAAERKEQQTYEYNDEEHTAAEWAEILGVSATEMQEFLDMGMEMQDIVETLADQELEEDEKELIDKKVNEAVEKAKAAKSNGNGSHDEEPKEVDLDLLSEEEMEVYLMNGTVPERLQTQA